MVIGVSACNIGLPDLFPISAPFIVKGTFEERAAFLQAPCPVWVDTTGVVYHLFQNEVISNEDFDRVTTPGVTSRLRLEIRRDLTVGCPMGKTVEVIQVLEIIQ